MKCSSGLVPAFILFISHLWTLYEPYINPALLTGLNFPYKILKFFI